MKVLSAVLTSGNLDNLRRAVNSFPDYADVVIICNSQDIFYVNDLMFSDLAKKYTIVRTESNGTPGQGKQSVVDYFKTTENDYLIQIDGDDFLYPGGYDLLCNIVAEERADVFGLVDEDILVDNSRFLNWTDTDYIAALTDAGASQADAENIHQYFKHVIDMAGNRKWPMSRLICISKRAADYTCFSNTMSGCEDLLQMCKYKINHINNNINYMLIDSKDIHLYNKSSKGGAGYKFVTETSRQDISEFYTEITNTDITKLSGTDLPVIHRPDATTRRGRYRHAIKYVKKTNTCNLSK